MDLLKIFRMSEPISKETLTRNPSPKTPKHTEQLNNINSETIHELEQEIINLKNTNMNLQALIEQIRKDNGSTIVDYEQFYMKIITESEIILNEKKRLGNKVEELEKDHQDLLKMYKKSEETVRHYETKYMELKQQIIDYEEIIHKLAKECRNLKTQFQNDCLIAASASTNSNMTIIDNTNRKLPLRQQESDHAIEPLPNFIPY